MILFNLLEASCGLWIQDQGLKGVYWWMVWVLHGLSGALQDSLEFEEREREREKTKGVNCSSLVVKVHFLKIIRHSWIETFLTWSSSVSFRMYHFSL